MMMAMCDFQEMRSLIEINIQKYGEKVFWGCIPKKGK